MPYDYLTPSSSGEQPDDDFMTRLAKSGVLSPLIWLGQTLDKPGRAIRGVLGGDLGALANLIPMSDTLGITNPEDSVSGRDLLRKAGLAGQEDNWGNFAGGLGLEMLLDPLNFVTLGTKSSLTAAGQLAKKAGTLEGTAAARIGAGQAGLMGLRTPWYLDALTGAPGRMPLGTGALSENIAEKAAQSLDYLTTKAPIISGPLGTARSLFEYGTGFTRDKRIVGGFSGVNPAAEAEIMNLALPERMRVYDASQQAVEGLARKGVPLGAAQDAWGRAVTGAVEGGFAESPYIRDLPVAARPQAAADLQNLASLAAPDIATIQDTIREGVQTYGKKIKEAPGYYDLNYLHRQSQFGGMSRTSQQTGRSIPSEVLPGGSRQLDDLVNATTAAGEPIYAGIGKMGLPPAALKSQIESNAESIFNTAKAHRDALAPTMSPKELAALSDKVLADKSDRLARFLANNVDPAMAKTGRGYYRNDPMASILEYQKNLASQAGSAAGSIRTLAREAVDATAASGADMVPLSDALKELGLNAQEKTGKNVAYGGKLTLLEQLADLGKTSVNPATPMRPSAINAELAQKYVPRDLIQNLSKELAGPGYKESMGFGQLAENVSSAFRTAVTVPWIPYHVRNLFEGALQQGLGGGLSAGGYGDAAAYLRGGLQPGTTKAAEVAKYANEAYNTGAAFRNQAYSQLGESVVNKEARAIQPWVTQEGKTAAEGASDYLKSFSPSAAAARGESYLGTTFDTNALVQRGIDAHNKVDNLNRFSQYISLRRQGYAPEAATDIVSKSQLDYSKLTQAERSLRQVIPFYSFSKQNLGRTIGQLQDPGPLASLLRATTEASQNDYVPGYISQGAAIPIGEGEDGKQRYLSGLNLPFEDELFGSAVSLASGHPVEAVKRAMSSAGPLVKLASSLATGRDLYTGQSLEAMNPSPVASLGGLIPQYQANVMSQVLSATPLGRVASTTNSLIGGKDQTPWLKLLTGIKTTDVDQTMATQYAARDALTSQLLQSGMVGSSQNIYAKPEYRGDNQPEQLRGMLGLLQMIEQQSKATRQSRQLP